jgi:hypothetical protein
MKDLIRKIRRTANWGLYGSIAVVLVAVIFHFSPWHITYQSAQVSRWMLISGAILSVLAVAMALLTIRKTTPRLRQLDSLEAKMQGYSTYISNLYRGSLAIVIIECVLIVLMSDTSLLMITILLVLLLFLSYPNMYKMKNDLGLNDDEMKSLFGDAYIAGTQTAYDEPAPDLPLADAQLAKDEEAADATVSQPGQEEKQ